jgi:predicted  nucleic acid-binding Zn-ribbon protein
MAEMTQSGDLPELLRCINCGWVYYAAAADEKALESCFKCACSEFEPVGPAAVPRGVTILPIRQQRRGTLADVLAKFAKFSPDFMDDGRGDQDQAARTVEETNAAPGQLSAADWAKAFAPRNGSPTATTAPKPTTGSRGYRRLTAPELVEEIEKGLNSGPAEQLDMDEINASAQRESNSKTTKPR